MKNTLSIAFNIISDTVYHLLHHQRSFRLQDCETGRDIVLYAPKEVAPEEWAELIKNRLIYENIEQTKKLVLEMNGIMAMWYFKQSKGQSLDALHTMTLDEEIPEKHLSASPTLEKILCPEQNRLPPRGKKATLA